MLNGKKSLMNVNVFSIVDQKMRVFWETVYSNNESIDNRASRAIRLLSGYPFDI